MKYTIEFKPSAYRQFKRFPSAIAKRIDARIIALADNPRPRGVEKLAGYERAYRIRVGDYRVLYEIYDDVLVVYVIRVAHRREAYR